MNKSFSNTDSIYKNDEIDLKDFFYMLFLGKWIIISITLLASIASVYFSLKLPNIYQSKALLVPVESSSGNAGVLGGYSGLASLAGVNLSSVASEDNSVKALEKLETLSFFENNILRGIYLPNLMALKSWDANKNALIYDEDVYNKNQNMWIRNYSYPQKQKPSPQESFVTFKSKHLYLSKDDKTGIVSLSITHKSPHIAKKWTELYVKEINSFYRQKDKSEAQKSITYLNTQIAKTNLSEIKYVMAELLQQEIQKLTLIEASEFYVFEYIDNPVVMENKYGPNRALICILGALIGGMIGFLIVLIRHVIMSKKNL